MISIELYVTISIAAVLLAMYGLLDMRNRFYANIAALFMASLIAWYLSITVSNGTLSSGYVINQTSGATTPIILQDASLGWLLVIPAVAAMIAVAYLIYDAYEEQKRDTREEEERS